MNRERYKTIMRFILMSLDEKPTSIRQCIHLTCQYGKVEDVTPKEVITALDIKPIDYFNLNSSLSGAIPHSKFNAFI